MLWIWLAVAGLVVLGITLYWLLVITEGTYLGFRVVILLYDWAARRYDAIKNVHFVNEARYLGLPVTEALAMVPRPWVLDVATGTGRMPLALLREPDFQGVVVGIDGSLPMLIEGRAYLREHGERAALLLQDATFLGFMSHSFDAVTCLEAMEFMVHPAFVLKEMVRVLKPGGLLLVSNRVGIDARFFPGRMSDRGSLEQALRQLGLIDVVSKRWQVHYDLIWARKPPAGISSGPANAKQN